MDFDNSPHTDDMYCFPICRPRHRHPIAFTVATREWRGCWTHWYGGKTVVHTESETCMPCEYNVKKVWAGHVLGYRHEDDQLCMIIFTLPTKRFFEGHLDGENGIFSLSCRLVRMGGRETGPVAALCLGRDSDRVEQSMWVLEKIVKRLYADNANQQNVNLPKKRRQR